MATLTANNLRSQESLSSSFLNESFQSERRRSQPALPKIPRGRGNQPLVVKNVKSSPVRNRATRHEPSSSSPPQQETVHEHHSMDYSNSSNTGVDHHHSHHSSSKLGTSARHRTKAARDSLELHNASTNENNTLNHSSNSNDQRRMTMGPGVDKKKMQKLLQGNNIDDSSSGVDLDEDPQGRRDTNVSGLTDDRMFNLPRDKRRNTSISGLTDDRMFQQQQQQKRKERRDTTISALTEDMNMSQGEIDNSEEDGGGQDRERFRNEDEDDEEDVDNGAQEQAVAIANQMQMHRQAKQNNGHYHSDDGTIESGRSMRSGRSHRSRDHLDPDLDFLHSSVIDDARTSQKGDHFIDEDDLLGASFDDDDETCWEAFWGRVGGILLCFLFCVIWAGVIPYCIVRYRENEANAPPDILLTPPPTESNMIPWTKEPTFSPGTPSPTSLPTTIYENQELFGQLTTSSQLDSSMEANSTSDEIDGLPFNATDTDPVEESVIASTTSPVEVDDTIPPTAISTTAKPTAITTSLAPSQSPTFMEQSQPPTNVTATSSPSTTPTTATTTSAPTTTPPTTRLPTNIPTMPPEAPTASPSATPTREPDVVWPEYTLQAFNNPSSPQSKAFSWMLRDPNFGDYGPNRMRQRFALASLYYSTNGDDWSVQTAVRSAGGQRSNLMPWLSYAGHECDWYYKKIESETSSRANTLLSMYSATFGGVVVCENEMGADGELFRSFRSLWLENAGLQGTLPPELAFLTGLEELHLTNNDLFGTIPPQWFWDDKDTAVNWQTSLQQLMLGNNTIAGSIPSEIGLALNLEKFEIQDNDFREQIPSEIGQLGKLQHLLAGTNRLTGTIPTEVGRLSSMTACSWNNNELSGSIPTEFGRCFALEELYLAQNSLTGPIPWELCFLRSSLVDLHLYSNQLVANIPTRIGLLTKLRWFHVGDNQLTGEIPTELGKMTMMQLFQIENNSFRGQLPSEHLVSWDIAARVWLHNNPDLYGTIPYGWCPGGKLANGTTIDEGRSLSIDIRVDCNSKIKCPCKEGCSCERRQRKDRFLRGCKDLSPS